MRISDWSSDVCSSDLLYPRDVPLSVRAHPHGACPQLHDGRRAGAVQADDRARRPAPDGLGRLWHAGGKCRDGKGRPPERLDARQYRRDARAAQTTRSEEHTSELQSLMRMSYAVFFLKK